MFPDPVETESLVLRRLSVDEVDVLELYDLFAEGKGGEDVFEYVPGEPYGSVADAREWLVGAAEEWDDAESAKYATFRDDGTDGTLGGVAALTPRWDRRTGSLGVMLARPHWGHGFAGECALALAKVAFERLDLDLVSIGYEEGNERSGRAIEKFVERVGGRHEGVLRNWTPVGEDVADHYRYTVTREEYREAFADPSLPR